MASDVKSKAAIKRSDVKESVAKRCTLDKRKEPTPKASDSKRAAKVVPQPKNHVLENITFVRNVKMPERPQIVQDSCDGHRQDVGKAGLKLKYVFKKEYGEVPQYIRKKRLKEEKNENSTIREEPGVRKVDEEEKQRVLEGLRRNLREVEKLLLSLPLIIDTISKNRYKKELENRWQQFQQNIEMLENHDVLVISEKE